MANKSLRTLLLGGPAAELPITVNINITQPLGTPDEIAKAVLAALSHARRVGSARI